MSWNGNYFWANSVREKTVEYQMVDNTFPMSTEQFQKDIEVTPIVIKTELVTRYKTRYIIVTVNDNMTESEIFNLGKRISIIEQNCINKSKELYDNTINRGVHSRNRNEAENKLYEIDRGLRLIRDSNLISTTTLKSVISDILVKVADYKKSKLKPKQIKTRASKDKFY